MNGIAYDSSEDVFYLTGKWWPKYYKGALFFLMSDSKGWLDGCVYMYVFERTKERTSACVLTPPFTTTTTVKMCGLSKDAAADSSGVCAVNSAGGK